MSASFRFTLLALAGVVVPGVSSALTPSWATEPPTHGGELIVAIGNDISTVNPAITPDLQGVMVGCGIYQGLVNVSQDFKITPLLAQEWTVSSDGLTYSFKLRSAKWSDGQPFTSADVAYSLPEVNAKMHPLFRASGEVIDHIDTPALDEVVIHLKRPLGPFLMSLSCIQGGAILPQHIFKDTDIRANPASSDAPVGTGPFLLKKWTRGESIALVRNPTYWDAGKPYLDGVIVRVIPQSTSRLQALQSGDVDFIQGWALAPSDQSVVEKTPNLKLETSGYASGTTMDIFNVNRKPLDDARVRRALAMATDRDFLLTTAWFGDGVASTQPFSSSIAWAANPNIDFRKMYPFDLVKANELLDEAGLKRGPDGIRTQLKVYYSSDSPDKAQAAFAMKSFWQKVGIQLVPQAVERAVFNDLVYSKRDFDTALEALNTFGDPALGITRIYATDMIGRAYANASGYSNSQVDQLFLEGRGATTTNERATFYRQAQDIIAKDLPVLPIREARMQDGATKRLHGLWGSLGAADWANAWLSPN